MAKPIKGEEYYHVTTAPEAGVHGYFGQIFIGKNAKKESKRVFDNLKLNKGRIIWSYYDKDHKRKVVKEVNNLIDKRPGRKNGLFG